GLEVEAVEVPVRVVIDEITEERDAERGVGAEARRRSRDESGPAQRLAAAHDAGIVAGADDLVGTRPDLLDRLDLRRGEAGVGVLARLAGELRRREIAGARVVEHAVRDAVLGVAGGVDRVADDRRLARRDVAGGIA